MSLANLLWVKNFFWDGRTEGLEQKAVVPLTDPHEMGQSLGASSKKLSQTKAYPLLFEKDFGTKEIDGKRIVNAIAQFERTLISANSKYDRHLRGEIKLTDAEQRGLNIFETKGNCANCHGGPKTFIELFYNNGLDSVQGRFSCAYASEHSSHRAVHARRTFQRSVGSTKSLRWKYHPE